jgi:hypothetical protein
LSFQLTIAVSVFRLNLPNGPKFLAGKIYRSHG